MHRKCTKAGMFNVQTCVHNNGEGRSTGQRIGRYLHFDVYPFISASLCWLLPFINHKVSDVTCALLRLNNRWIDVRHKVGRPLPNVSGNTSFVIVLFLFFVG